MQTPVSKPAEKWVMVRQPTRGTGFESYVKSLWVSSKVAQQIVSHPQNPVSTRNTTGDENTMPRPKIKWVRAKQWTPTLVSVGNSGISNTCLTPKNSLDFCLFTLKLFVIFCAYMTWTLRNLLEPLCDDKKYQLKQGTSAMSFLPYCWVLRLHICSREQHNFYWLWLLAVLTYFKRRNFPWELNALAACDSSCAGVRFFLGSLAWEATFVTVTELLCKYPYKFVCQHNLQHQ